MPQASQVVGANSASNVPTWRLGAQIVGVLGKELRARRVSAGLSIRDLANIVGVSTTYILRLEKGMIARPQFLPLLWIAEALDIDIRRVAAPYRSTLRDRVDTMTIRGRLR